MPKTLQVKVMTTEVRLIEKKDESGKKSYRVTVNGADNYYPFDDETKAKAAAFEEVLRAQREGKVYVSWDAF